MNLFASVEILPVILWILLGVAAGFIYIWLIKKSAYTMNPEAKTSAIVKMLASLILRLVGMGILIYLAIIQNALYGVVFVLVFSITHFILIHRMTADQEPQNPLKVKENKQ